MDKYLDSHVGITDDAARYDVETLHSHMARDSELLGALAAEARTVSRADDPTLAELAEQLAAIAAEAESTGIGAGDTRDRRKVLIFSYFADVAGADGNRAGYVFCVQVGDRVQPQFCFVELPDRTGARTPEGGDAGGRPAERFRQTLPTTTTGGPDRTGARGEPLVIAETLACLDRARPPDGLDTPAAGHSTPVVRRRSHDSRPPIRLQGSRP